MCVGERRQQRGQPAGFAVPQQQQRRKRGGTSSLGPRSQVELTLSARALADRDVTSKSDPFCAVYRLTDEGEKEVDRTETINNQLNPNWSKKIRLDYFFESKQPLLFKLYDVDPKKLDFLGVAQCDLADIVAAESGALSLRLTGAKFVKGELIIRADEIKEGQRHFAQFRIQAVGLPKSFFGRPNVFLEFYRLLGDGSRQLAHRTEVVYAPASPQWVFELATDRLCGGQHDQEFLIECFNYKQNGSHKPLGQLRASVNKLVAQPGVEIPLQNVAKGTLRFENVILRREYSFVDFVTGGLQLEFAVCIDFTASNGAAIHDPSSLHYTGGTAFNQYEAAIRSVLDICAHYNHRKMFTAFGFGAKVPPNYQVSHLFPLDLRGRRADLNGTDGVLEAYKAVLENIELSGPTNFEPAVREFARRAAAFPRDASRYQILLIITDGAITDMERTKQAIVDNSNCPFSIIIVGVGDASFQEMEELDSDDELLRAPNGTRAKRDIFVPFRKFVHTEVDPANDKQREAVMRRLAKEVLEEIPAQVSGLYNAHGMAPVRPPASMASASKNSLGSKGSK